MHISPEQYRRFLNNQCSEEERLLMTAWLEQHPEALEELIQADDWEQFNHDLRLHPALSARMRDHFLAHIHQQRQRRKKWYRVSVAAAIVAVLAWPTCWLLLPQHSPQPVAVKEVTRDTAWQEVRNTGNAVMKVEPGDGSVIKLYAHSTLRYPAVMPAGRRDVYLQGIARFEVAKDKTRPFTVYAGGIATTALGTSFTVMAEAGRKDVDVKLHEGKVVVRPVDSAGVTVKPVYLLPGDEVVMSAGGKYNHLHLAKKEPADPILKKNKPAGGNALSFSNLPLTDVLEQLKEKFGADIRYDEKTISTIYITASFTEQDTLSDILNILCTLNNLQLQKTGAVFAISR